MGLKKYEIITVGSDKRVRALRSWQVGDRYVNIGDVGGIVYDEKTLSQDGACWLFRGNFGFPGARIGGDSIVDVAEAALSTAGAPNVDILGSSVVVGSKLQFESGQTAANAVVLTAADFEQGTFGTYVVGQPIAPVPAANYIRTKNPIFLGGNSLTVKVEVPGYSVGAVSVDADGLVIAPATTVASGAGVTLTIPAGQYAHIRLGKDPVGPTVPADATTAKITFTGTYETKLSIIDSRVEINPANSKNTVFVKPGGFYTMAPGVKYPEYIIRNSKVSINVPAAANKSIRLMGQIIESTALLDCTTENLTLAGTYSNIKNLTASGVLTTNVGTEYYGGIQATDCDNFAVSPTIFPGLAAAQTANMPFIFQGCNVPNGLFYHHAQIANTYKSIDFAKASADLGKAIASGEILASSEVEGMYRLYSTTGSVFGALVEAHDSVKFLNMTGGAATYGTTIYKDAYLNGLFDIAGTNVFGNKVRSHPLAQVLNVQPRVVQGMLNTAAIGQTITGIVGNPNRVVTPKPFRVNSGAGLSVNNVPSGIEVVMFFVTDGNVITNSASATSVPTARLIELQAYLVFKKIVDGPITPEDLAGVTVTTYNGCKIMNTGETAVIMKGNIRVEDNATLVNASITGTGYFGGNSVAYYNPTVWASLDFNGTVYMKDNTVFAPSVVGDRAGLSLLEMKDNAVFAGQIGTGNRYNITMANNAQFFGSINSRSGWVMRDNSYVASAAVIDAACRGLLIMRDDARIEKEVLTTIGYITLCGKYTQTAYKRWTGKRVIDDQNAPEYDNNVKTQYDF